MIYFKAKIAILLTGILFLSGCSFFGGNLSHGVSIVREKALNKPQEIETKEVSLLFIGDLMFDRYIREITEKKGNDFIFEKMADFLKNNDLVMANLEGPISDNESVSIGTILGEKGHLSFTFDKSLAGILAKQNIKLLNIGNNHILNFGENGLEQTKKYLVESGVEYFGDPKSLENNYFIKEIGGIKMGFVSYNQFGGRVEETTNSINSIRDEVDIVVVYTHWGKEYEKTPSDKIKNLAHSFVDAGADLIIGSHPHVVQDVEEYKGRKIYYSLGNFIFDQYFSAETMEGLAVKVEINSKNKQLKFQEIPLIMEKNGQTRL
jgi:poly-gamma-glutamate synthesis protein (capsule biosynthesis protein)